MSENPLSPGVGTDTVTHVDTATAAAPSGICRCFVQRLAMVSLMLLLLLLVLGLFVPMVMYVYRHVFVDEPGSRAMVVQNAGRVVSVSQSGGFITRALVETDLGYYALMDGVSLNKNEALTLETRADKTQFLCDSQHRCLRLAVNGQTQ